MEVCLPFSFQSGAQLLLPGEYDAVSRMSLAERVCTGDKSLHLSGVQMGLIDDIGKYLKPTKEGVSPLLGWWLLGDFLIGIMWDNMIWIIFLKEIHGNKGFLRDFG